MQKMLSTSPDKSLGIFEGRATVLTKDMEKSHPALTILKTVAKIALFCVLLLSLIGIPVLIKYENFFRISSGSLTYDAHPKIGDAEKV